MKTIKHIIIKEFLQIKRDKKLFRIVFIAPIIQLLFLGYAANLDLDNIKIWDYVVSEDPSEYSSLSGPITQRITERIIP